SVRQGEREPLALSLGDAFVHSPSIVGTPGGFVLLWMEQTQGIYNTAHVARFTPGGTRLGGVEIDTTDIPSVYPLDLVRLDEGHFFVVWQEGTSPAFRVHARAVAL